MKWRNVGLRSVWVPGLVLCLFVSNAFGQATAPVTHDRHTHHHNDKHPVDADQTRIITNRKGASIDLPTDQEMFTFIVFGDRTGGPNEGVDVLADAVADANLLEPDMVMTVGDLVQGYNQTEDWMQQMRQYKQVMDELRCPWLPVAGNHDIYWRGKNKPEGEHEASYEMHFGPLWYAFEHKNCWFIVLYSDEGDPKTGKKAISRPESQKMSPQQFDWLKQTLGKAKGANHVFVFLHHPRWTGGTRYGDDWQKVHKALVGAGNVTAVFAGHLHNMFHIEKDGIEYVTLATVGGGQSGRAPEAGYLHQFHHVTVRKNQIALASIPVGQAMDVRQITREVSQMARKLSDVFPEIDTPIEVASDGSADTTFRVTVNNPVESSIEIELTPASADSRWGVTPDHIHQTLPAGGSATLAFNAVRPQGSLDHYTRPIEVALAMDLLTDTARYAIPTRSVRVPGSVVVPEPKRPDSQRVLRLNGKQGGAVVEAASLKLKEGPITFECWVRPSRFDKRDGVIGAPGFGLFFEAGKPVCYIANNGKTVHVRMPKNAGLQAGKTYHLAGVYDGETLRFYIDGQLVNQAKATGGVSLKGSPVMIGADTSLRGPTNTLPGWIDSVRISAKARYKRESFVPERDPGADDATVLLLQMDQDQGGNLYDHSGNRAHAVLRGSAAVVVPKQ